MAALALELSAPLRSLRVESNGRGKSVGYRISFIRGGCAAAPMIYVPMSAAVVVVIAEIHLHR